MIFDKTTILGSSTEYKYFGSNLYNYKKIKTLKVEGFLIDGSVLGEESTANNTAIDGFLSTATMESVDINGKNFGTGKLTQISFSDDDLSPNLKKVSATIEIYEDPLTIDGGGGGDDSLNSLLSSTNSTKFLESLSESFSFSESVSSKTFDYSVDILYLDDETNNRLDLSQTLALALIEKALANQLIDGYNADETEYKLYRTENIDEISRSYSLSHKYDFVKPSSSEDATTHDRTIETSVSTDRNGITTVTEKGVIRHIGTINATSMEELETEATNQIETDSFTRCETAFQGFDGDADNTGITSTPYGSPNPLVDKRISVVRDIDERNLTINYTVTYSNDISIQDTYSWSYNHEIKKTESFYLVSERGQIVGDGKPFPIGSSSIEVAKTAWDTVYDGIKERIEAEFKDNTIDFRQIFISTEDVNYSEIDGTITYAFTYSSEPKEGDPEKITTKNTVTHSYPVDLKNNFNILKDTQISQKLNLATVGNTTLNMELRGQKETTFKEYIGFVNENISKYTPDEELTHISSSPKISFTPKKNLMTFSINWNWLRKVADIDDI